MLTASCYAPYGIAGLGQMLAQVVEEARAQGIPCHYFAAGRAVDDPACQAVEIPWADWAIRCTPVRFSPSWRVYLGCVAFDRAVARQLAVGTVFHGFDGMSLCSFRRCRQLKYERLELEAAMSHASNLRRQLNRAYRDFPVEAPDLNRPLLRRKLAEYAMVDVIWVSSEYSRQSFLWEGVPASKLQKRALRVANRFSPPAQRPDDDVFRVVYIGSLNLRKGIPVLLEAFHRLPGRAELILVGGSGTRGMRRYLDENLRRDSRVRIAPGDPLPHLHQANVCVHPTYEDGFGYAPMEALACGVPVIVTEDTGMKEHVREGVNGYVVPTGSWQAILERLEHLRRHPLLNCAPPCES